MHKPHWIILLVESDGFLNSDLSLNKLLLYIIFYITTNCNLQNVFNCSKHFNLLLNIYDNCKINQNMSIDRV
jgi:hypothetical protein